MIIVDITEEQISLAEQKAKELGKLRNSITKGEGNVVGILGEILVSEYFNGVIKNTYDYDVVINNKKVDVKTKKTTVEPEPHYLASVAAYNTKQQCDAYYFVRIDLVKKKGYLLGGLTKKKFFSKAIFYKLGEVDPTSPFGWTFTADCYNVPISKLKNPKVKI